MLNPYEPPAADLAIPSDQPTRARFIVLAFLCAMAFVLYLDRVCMSKAVEPIRDDLGISKSQMGWVLAAFTLAYGLFEVPTGRWGDRYGSRRVLTRIVIWWSAFTMLTAACTGFGMLLIVRFLFGAGEAGAYPNAARVIARWFPVRERGRVQGIMLAAALIGATLAPIIAGYLIRDLGWRWSFVIFGGTGVFWAAAFFWWFRDDPQQHVAANAIECQLITADGPAPEQHHEPIPWAAVFRHRTIGLLGAIVTCGSFNSYLYFSWYATYLEKGRGVESVDAGWLAGLALAGAAVGQLGGGFVLDGILRRFENRVVARRVLGCVSYSSAAALLAVSVNCDSSLLSAVFAAASCCLMFVQQSAWWSSAVEVSGKHVGSLFGLMNGLGVFGAMGSQVFFGHFADWRATQGFAGRAQWDPAFYVVVGVLLIGAIGWLFVDPTKRVDEA